MPIEISEIQMRGIVVRQKVNGLFEIADGFFRIPFLCSQHSQVVPGFREGWMQLHGPLQIQLGISRTVAPEVQRAEVVVGICVVRIGCNNLLKKDSAA